MISLRSRLAAGSLLGAFLAGGCSTETSLNPSSDSSRPSQTASFLSKEEPQEFLARGVLPGSDLSRHAYSGNGNLVAFCSQDSSLVTGDSNGHSDVFVYSRYGGSYVRASLSASGQEPNGPCWRAAVSGDGRYVVFDSSASNLVSGDTNNRSDVFRKDLQTGQVVVVSAGPSSQSNGASDQAVISDDGHYVAFRSSASNLIAGDNNRVADIFVRDLQGNTTQLLSRSGLTLANGACANPSISGDGRFVSFETTSTNLPDSGGGQPLSGRSNVFVRDLQANSLSWCSRRPDGGEGSGIAHSAHLAGNGSGVAFVSTSSDLSATAASGEQIYFRPLSAGLCSLVSQNLGVAANGSCRLPVLSNNGQRVAYLSQARNLSPGKNEDYFDVFLTDRLAGTTTRQSNPAGAGNDAACEQVALSPDGQQAIFRTLASTLGAGDLDNDDDIFSSLPEQITKYKDLIRVSLSSGGAEANAQTTFSEGDLSSDGRFVAFSSTATNLVNGDTNGQSDIFVRDTATGSTTRVSIGASGQSNGFSSAPSISADGRYVAFSSNANNLVADDTNNQSDVFVHDRLNGNTTRTSFGALGQSNASSNSPSISEDGQFVAFTSNASNLVSGDTNGARDVFVFNTQNSTVTRVSTGAGGQSNGFTGSLGISGDGRYVTFSSSATNLVSGDTNSRDDVFVRDTVDQITTRVSLGPASLQGNDVSDSVSISADGRYVAFRSDATNLVAGDTNAARDIFVHDRQNGTTTLASTGISGQANSTNLFPSISADGHHVIFLSLASNLVAGDTNNAVDIFVRDLVSQTTTMVVGTGVFSMSIPLISHDGQAVAFVSPLSNLVGGDTNGVTDMFLRRMAP